MMVTTIVTITILIITIIIVTVINVITIIIIILIIYISVMIKSDAIRIINAINIMIRVTISWSVPLEPFVPHVCYSISCQIIPYHNIT